MAHLHLLHGWALLLVRVWHMTLLRRLERPRAAKLARVQLRLRLRQAAHEGQLRRRCAGRCDLRCNLQTTGQFQTVLHASEKILSTVPQQQLAAAAAATRC
jgi:hypothetical protein